MGRPTSTATCMCLEACACSLLKRAITTRYCLMCCISQGAVSQALCATMVRVAAPPVVGERPCLASVDALLAAACTWLGCPVGSAGMVARVVGRWRR